MTEAEISRALIAALEGVKSDLAGIDMRMEDYARVANKITGVVGAASRALDGDRPYFARSFLAYRTDTDAEGAS
jgi:hypothetical protein